jgi:hypothetical protein
MTKRESGRSAKAGRKNDDARMTNVGDLDIEPSGLLARCCSVNCELDDLSCTAAQTATAPRRRLRWFQFRLRTVFVLTTLMAFAAAWVGWQIRIVRERKWLREHSPHASFLPIENFNPITRNQTWPKGPPRVPWYRRMLGDEAIYKIGLEQDSSENDELKRLEAAFPEAIVSEPANGGSPERHAVAK